MLSFDSQNLLFVWSAELVNVYLLGGQVICASILSKVYVTCRIVLETLGGVRDEPLDYSEQTVYQM